MKRQKYEKTERWKDWETKRQKDKKTESRKDRKNKRQNEEKTLKIEWWKDKKTKKNSTEKTERQKYYRTIDLRWLLIKGATFILDDLVETGSWTSGRTRHLDQMTLREEERWGLFNIWWNLEQPPPKELRRAGNFTTFRDISGIPLFIPNR